MMDAQTSPYLQRAADAPVHWYPWGPDAFAEAARRDVPVLLSIGYSACRWCEIMMHTSFRDPGVVAALNDGFVAILVDRDERPDIDSAYMSALHALNARPGWPLTAVLDERQRPFWITTFVPAEPLAEALTTIADSWRADPQHARAAADALTAKVVAATSITPADGIPGLDAVNDGLTAIAAAFDPEWGGFGEAPKFPSAPHVSVMLRAAMASGAPAPADIVNVTLDAMSAGGICDQIGGGFMRYSTDREWLVPQFEKMLYDQAQLATVYRAAFSLWGQPSHRQVVEDTIGYVLDTLATDEGGFLTSQSHGMSAAPSGFPDGAEYTWTPDEIRTIFERARVGDEPVDVDAVLDWFDITPSGHLNGRSIPNRRLHRGDQVRPPKISAVRHALATVRATRRRSEPDRTVITEHHALMVHALASCAGFFRRDDWRAAALAGGRFLVEDLRRGDGGWARSWNGPGRSGPPALAGDYAHTIVALIRLASLTGQAEWISHARAAADTLLDQYFDPIDGGLWNTSEFGEQLYVHTKSFEDRTVPSPNATAADGLLRLAAVTGELRYKHHAERILQLAGGVIATRAVSMPHTLEVLELVRRGLTQIVIVDSAERGGRVTDRADGIAVPTPRSPSDEVVDDERVEVDRMVRLMETIWRPNFVMVWGERFESPLWDATGSAGAYVGRDFELDGPFLTAEALFERLTGQPLPDGAQIGL